MKTKKLGLLIFLVLGAMFSQVALTAEETTLGNNLSLPTKFVPGNAPDTPAVRVPCNGWIKYPTPPLTYLDPPPITDRDGYTTDLPADWYFLQKTASTWTAPCVNTNPAVPMQVTTKWGDNLVGDGKIRARKPVRVEMVLTEYGGVGNYGFKVWKLTNEDDRYATYGTGGFRDLLVDLPYRVHDSGAQFAIDKCRIGSVGSCSGWQVVVAKGPMSAEINSTGGVVYGYNWGIMGTSNSPGPGVYRLRFWVNNTTIIDHEDSKARDCFTWPVQPIGECSEVVVELTSSGQ